MKKYVFLTNQYLGSPEATGICVQRLAEFLLCKGADVDVVCYGRKRGILEQNGIVVHTVKAPTYLLKQSNGFLQKKIDRAKQLLDKLIHIRNYPLRSSSLVRGYVSSLKRIISGSKDVTVIATFTPVEAVVAAAKIKKCFDDVKIVYYSLDTLSNEGGNSGFLSAKYRAEKGTQLEKRLFSCFDRIIIMECHKDHYYSEAFSQFQSKFYLANFPLLTANKVTQNEITSVENEFVQNKTIVFAGTFYRKLRNPTFLCEVLDRILKQVPFKVVFLGGGDCQDILQTLQKKHPQNVCILGPQPHAVAMHYIQNANVLVSVGNADCPMAPSKIYEYMATGKPILHFYSYEKDPCLNPLIKYGNALLINQHLLVDCNEVLDFINTTSNKNIDDVIKTFKTSTPAYTAEIIECKMC